MELRAHTYARGALWVVLLLCATGIVVPIGMRAAVSAYLHTDVGDARPADAALVLGASVVRGAPSPILAERASVAIDLYKKGIVRKVLVSGDNGALSHDEVTPVRKYLVASGVKPEDIFLDHAGFDTYSSMYRARDVFGVRSLIVPTQDFHLPRAVWVARSLGMEAQGLSTGMSGTWWDYLREIPASCKALLDVLGRRTPKFLGQTFPIEGDGTGTWY